MAAATAWVVTAGAAAPLPGRGRARTRSDSSSAVLTAGVDEEAVRASIGPALNPSCRASESNDGQTGGRPARASAPMAVSRLAMPPCLGWFVITGTWGLPSRICMANMVNARLGPTSTKTRPPASYMVSTCLVHSTEEAICGASCSKIAALESAPCMG